MQHDISCPQCRRLRKKTKERGFKTVLSRFVPIFVSKHIGIEEIRTEKERKSTTNLTIDLLII